MNNDQNNTIDLQELFTVLYKNLLFIIIVTFVFTALVGGYTMFFVQKKYVSNTLISVETINDTNTQSSDAFRIGIELSKRYSVISKSNTVIDNVIEKLEDENDIIITSDALKNCFTVIAEKDTNILKLTVTYKNPVEAKIIANALTSESMKVYQEKYKASISIIDNANYNNIPVSPSLKLNFVIGFLLGGMISVGIVLIKEFLNRKVKSEKDIEQLLNISYFGSIPDLNKVKNI